MQSTGLAVLAAVGLWTVCTAIATYAQTKPAQTKPVDGSDVVAGRTLAMQACTSCHVVAADQPYMPIYKGAIHPPDFKDIANKPNVDAAWLRSYLASLPVIPKYAQMANVDLTEEQMRDVSAFIMTLRDKAPQSSSQSSR